MTGYIPNTGSCTAEAIIPDYTITHLYLFTHLIPDKHKKLFADLKKIHDDILNIRILI